MQKRMSGVKSEWGLVMDLYLSLRVVWIYRYVTVFSCGPLIKVQEIVENFC